MAKKERKKVLRKQKKKWFVVKAPACMNSAEIGEVTAFEPKELVGRTVCIPLKEITGSGRDSSSKIKMRIVEVQGETCKTEPLEIFMQNSQVGRMDRRAKTKIVSVVDSETKDKQKVRIKVYILLQNRVARNIQTVLQQASHNFVTEFVKKRELKDIFNVTTPKTISNNLKKELKKIYPANVLIWRIKKLP